MALTDLKFKESDFLNRKIADLSDTPSSDGMTAADLKAYFDYVPKTLIALGKINSIIDELLASTGGENIGAAVTGVTGTTVTAIMGSLKAMVDDTYTKAAADLLLGAKADNTTVASMVKSIEFDQNTGVFTITEQGGTAYTFDTLLEKLAVNFDFDEDAQVLTITLDDGTTKTVDMSALITEYEFLTTETIAAVVSGGKVSMGIKAGSITDEMLSSALLATMSGYVTACASSAAAAESSKENAKQYADNAAGSASGAAESETAAAGSAGEAAGFAGEAEGSAQEAESWARGTRNGTTVPTTDPAHNNNAKYFAEQAGTKANDALISAENAEESALDAEAWSSGTRGGVPVPASDPAYNNNAKYYMEQAEEVAGGSYVTETTFNEHTGNNENPHGVTKKQVGLEHVPNVTTDNQTPTVQKAATLTELVNGDTMKNLIGKIAKAVSDLIAHLADEIKHITAAERTKWNGKENAAVYSNSTLLSSGWNQAEKEYSFEAAYPASQYHVKVQLAKGTDEQKDAWAAAAAVGSATENVLSALGDIPAIDIPIILTVIKK